MPAAVYEPERGDLVWISLTPPGRPRAGRPATGGHPVTARLQCTGRPGADVPDHEPGQGLPI